MAVLVVNVAQHVLVAREVAAGQDDALRAGHAHVAVVGAVLGHDGGHAAAGVLLQVLGVVAEEPLGAGVDGVLALALHDLDPAPVGKLRVLVTEDRRAGVVLEAGRVHDHAVVGRAAADVGVGVHPLLAHLVDDVVQELAGVLDVVLDEQLIVAALVAAEDLAHEVLRVDLARAVVERPLAVDRADLAADVELVLLGLRLHDRDRQAVGGGGLRRVRAGLAAANDHEVKGPGVLDVGIVDRVGRRAPCGAGLGLPAVRGLGGLRDLLASRGVSGGRAALLGGEGRRGAQPGGHDAGAGDERAARDA